MRFIQATRTYNLTNEPHQGLHSFDEIAEHLLWVPYRCEPRRPMSSARVSQEEYDIAKHGWRVQPSPAQGIEGKATFLLTLATLRTHSRAGQEDA